MPSNACIISNCNALARYASLCQENNLVPIVEPEVLIDGNHSIKLCNEVTSKTLKCLFEQLKALNVYFEGVILKPSMVISGNKNTKRADYQTVADMTIQCLKKNLPNNLGGVAFLSGGQTNEESTNHLNIMNKTHKDILWRVTFSYARAIQQSALKVWLGEDANLAASQRVLSERAKLCSEASVGIL
jgi:fructose-bisphosphate aldolase class I